MYVYLGHCAITRESGEVVCSFVFARAFALSLSLSLISLGVSSCIDDGEGCGSLLFQSRSSSSIDAHSKFASAASLGLVFNKLDSVSHLSPLALTACGVSTTTQSTGCLDSNGSSFATHNLHIVTHTFTNIHDLSLVKQKI